MALAHSEAANPHWVPRKKIGARSMLFRASGVQSIAASPAIGLLLVCLEDEEAFYHPDKRGSTSLIQPDRGSDTRENRLILRGFSDFAQPSREAPGLP